MNETPWFEFTAHWDAGVAGIPKRDWGKQLVAVEPIQDGEEMKELRIFAVAPKANLIATTMPVGMLAGYSPDAVMVKAFEKNYMTPAKPGVVEKYGFEQMHGEPIELLDYVYETIFDIATQLEINRYRHNSKNYESARYVDYFKHGLTVVFPMEKEMYEEGPAGEYLRQEWLYDVVVPDFKNYVKYMRRGWKKQHARRNLGTYLATEGVIKVNLRSLWHMARQRSAELSPNGREAEPEIGEVVTQMVYEALPYIPNFADVLLEQIGKGYR